MSGSETGANAGNSGMQNPPPETPHPVGLAYSAADGTVVYRAVVRSSSAGGMRMQPKKRGRPRRYAPTVTPVEVAAASAPPAFTPPPPPPAQPPRGASRSRRPRGRRLGSGSGSRMMQQFAALGSPVTGFTPHVITVHVGEDVASMIMSFCRNGPKGICILSANGALSNVTVREAATSAGSVTYKGYFEILSLSGSFMLSDNDGTRTGGLSVSLAGPDGRILGGGVAGVLLAASPVQVIMVSFAAEGGKDLKAANQTEPLPAPSRLHSGIGTAGPSGPPSRGTGRESSRDSRNLLNQTAAVDSTPSSMTGLSWQ